MIDRRYALALAAAALVAATFAVTPSSAAGSPCPAPGAMTFAPEKYVDTTRAGGEPMIAVDPNGTLFYAAHAGTTHFFAPQVANATSAAFVDNYRGQTYHWYSTDNGATWTFVPRDLPNNDPLSGFSDPDYAIDSAGQVYLSEINLVNVAMSKSTDGGKSFTLQNFFAEVLTDRQWSEADQKDVLYIVGNASGGGTSTNPAGNNGHYLYRSTDGGKTFTRGQLDDIGGDGLGDLRVDKRNGTLYEAHYDSGKKILSMAAFRGARSGNLSPDTHPIATGVAMLGHWPAFDLDRNGNLYITWDELGNGTRPAGIYYSWSTDAGRTWAAPVRVDRDSKTDIWPWIGVGDPGRVGIAWLEADTNLPGQDTETTGSFGWRVMAAQTLTGLGCGGYSTRPGFTVTTVTPDPVHVGQICNSGTVCQAEAIDRRLGDYFSVAIDKTGAMVLAYSDTRQGGAVSLPGFSRQSGGPSFKGASPAFRSTRTPAGKTSTVLGSSQKRGSLANTGTADMAFVPAGLALVSLAFAVRRRLRQAP
jgi:hypothetical protein